MTMRGLATAVGVIAVALMVTPAGAQHQHHQAPPADPPRSNSVYELSVALVDQDGKQVGLDVCRGHPVLITMFYTTCRDACPLLIADLKRIERDLPAATRANLRIVLVSIDPEHDTVDALRALMRAHGLDPARWRLLRAPDDTVREIAAVLGIRYRRLPDQSFNHTSLITLLDASGAVVARVEGLGQPLDALKEGLRARR